MGARHPTVPQNGVDARSRIHLGHVALDAQAHLSFAENRQEAQTQCPPTNPDVMREKLEDESDQEAEYSFEMEEVENEYHIDIHTQELEVDEIIKYVFADHLTVNVNYSTLSLVTLLHIFHTS